MKVYVEVSKDRKDFFDDSEQIDLQLLKKEIEIYYGFETDYRIEPKENAIVFFNKSKIKQAKKLYEEVLG